MAEGFSIREYTWRMRSVDVVKCWPFDDVKTTYDERKMRSFLPQITVKKFRWWFDVAISGSNSKKVKRKKGLKRNGSVIEEAEESDDDDGDNRLASKKVKPPKRRSIVELFAVAPPVQTLHNQEDDDDYDRKEKKINKGHPQTRILCKQKFKKDKKQLNIKENGLMEFNIAKKKRPYKSVMHSPVQPMEFTSYLLLDNHLNEENIGAGWCEKKKPDLKSLAKGKKGKVVRSSKLFSDCLKPESSPDGILGKLDKVLSNHSSISHVLHKAGEKHHCGTRLSNLDEVIEKLRRKSSPVRCSKLREVSAVNSSDVALPRDCVQGTTEDPNSWVTNVTRSISGITEVNLSFEPILERNLFETHPLDKMNIISGTRNVQENSLNREDCTFLTEAHPLYACGSGPAVSLGDYGQQVNFQLPGSALFAPNPCRKFGSLSGNSFSSVNELYLKEYATAPLQSSWSSLSTLSENTAMHPRFIPEANTWNIRSNFVPRYPIPHLTPKELMHAICTTMNWKQNEFVHGQITLPEDFVGLPLNSQGELIKMNFKEKTVVGQLTTTSTIARNLTTLGAPTDVLCCRAKFSDVIRIPRISQKLDYQTLKHVNNFQIQTTNSSCQSRSTMRLMGKEVTVGERNLQQLEDGKVWIDKRTIVETLRGSNDIDKTQGLFGTTENSTTKLLRGAGASSTYLSNKESGPKQSLSSHNCEADLVERRGLRSARRNPSLQYLSSFCEASSHPFPKHGFVIQESAKCEYPHLSCPSPSSNDNVLARIPSSNNAHLLENMPCATSAPGFPVLHSRSTWSRGTSPSICPSWSFDIEKRAVMNCFPSFPDSLGSYYSECGPSVNIINDPSLDNPTFNCLSSPYCLKKPTVYNLSLLEEFSDTVKLAQKDYPSSEVDTHCDDREDKSCSISFLEKAKESDEFDSNESIDGSSELISGDTNDQSRTGPIKLAAGGKHILKPGKIVGQPNNPSPTSSTIRFVETTSNNNGPQSDEEPMRIYKF